MNTDTFHVHLSRLNCFTCILIFGQQIIKYKDIRSCQPFFFHFCHHLWNHNAVTYFLSAIVTPLKSSSININLLAPWCQHGSAHYNIKPFTYIDCHSTGLSHQSFMLESSKNTAIIHTNNNYQFLVVTSFFMYLQCWLNRRLSWKTSTGLNL